MCNIKTQLRYLLVVLVAFSVAAVCSSAYAADPLPTDDELKLDNFKIYTNNTLMNDGAKVKEGQEVEVTFDWTVNDLENKNTYSTNIPVQYVTPFTDYVEDNLFSNGVKIGKYKLENMGEYLRLTLELEDGVLEENLNMATGNVYIGGKLSIDANLEKPDGSNETIIFGDEELDVIYSNPGTMIVNHAQSGITDSGEIKYTFTARYKEIFEGTHFKVTLDKNLVAVPDSFLVKDNGGSEVAVTNVQTSDSEFSFDIPVNATSKLQEESFTVEYRCKLKSVPDFSSVTTEYINFNNVAELSYTAENGDIKKYTDTVIMLLEKPEIEAEGTMVKDEYGKAIKDHDLYEIWWTIRLNLNENWQKLLKNVDAESLEAIDVLSLMYDAIDEKGQYLVSEYPNFYGGSKETVSDPSSDITTTSAEENYGLYKRNGYKMFSQEVVMGLRDIDDSYDSYEYYYDKPVSLNDFNENNEFHFIVKQLLNGDDMAFSNATIDFFGLDLTADADVGMAISGVVAKYPMDTLNTYEEDYDDEGTEIRTYPELDAGGKKYENVDWCIGVDFDRFSDLYDLRDTSSDFAFTLKDSPKTPLSFEGNSTEYMKNTIIALYPENDEDFDTTLQKFKDRCKKRDDFWNYYEEYQEYKASADYSPGSVEDHEYIDGLDEKYHAFKSTANGVYEISLYDYNQKYSANASITSSSFSFDVIDNQNSSYTPSYSDFDITADSGDYIKTASVTENHFNDLNTLISEGYKMCVRIDSKNTETDHSYSPTDGFYQNFENTTSVEYKGESVEKMKAKFMARNLNGDTPVVEKKPSLKVEKSKKDSVTYNGDTYSYSDTYAIGWYIDATFENLEDNYEIEIDDAMTNGGELVPDSVLVFVGAGKTVTDDDTMLTPSTDYTVTNNNTTFKITLKKDSALYARLNGGQHIKVFYKASIPESRFFSNSTSISFRNSAVGSITTNDDTIFYSASANESKANSKFLTKIALSQDGEVQYKDDGTTIKNEPYISREDGRIWAYYNVDVNPRAIQINNGENYILVDIMTDVMRLDESSITVTGIDESEWSYEVDSENKQLKFNIPDGKTINLKYKVWFDVDTSDVNWMRSANTQNIARITINNSSVSSTINFSDYSYLVYIGGKIPHIMATGVKAASVPILLVMLASLMALLGYRRYQRR